MNNEENSILPGNISQPEPTKVRLVDVSIKDENTALNVMVSFMTLAHKRGTFSIEESAKIWECIKMFQKPNPN